MLGLPRFAPLMAFAIFLLVGAPRSALAQAARAVSMQVLAIDSDDADEQADALTNALRSRVRETQGWTLTETTQSLSMLTAAFQCPQHPDAACLDRIGDKLKSDQFVWGVLAKAPQHQVTAEVHLWQRGKPDHVARETFSDNLKDANDDNLKKVAAQVFLKLVGATTATLVIHTSGDTGSILVDGVAKGTLERGRATLTLPAGAHTIEIQAAGFAASKRDVTLEVGGSSQLEVVLEPIGPPGGEVGPSKPLPVRKIVGWTSIGAGVVLVAIGIGFGASWLSDESDLGNRRQNNYTLGSQVNPQTMLPYQQVLDPCHPPAGYSTSALQYGCNDVNAAHTALAGEITTFVAGGALAIFGTYLLLTDHPADPAAPPHAALSNVRLLPSAAPGGGSMVVVGQF